MRKKVFKLDADKLASLSTADLIAAREMRGNGGNFLHLETFHAIEAELRRRVDELLIAAGATVIEAESTDGEPAWGYPASVK